MTFHPSQPRLPRVPSGGAADADAAYELGGGQVCEIVG
jgi:hypothetical protein